MASTVNASSIADGLTPLADPSDPEEEIVPLRDTTANGIHRPMSNDHKHSNNQFNIRGMQSAHIINNFMSAAHLRRSNIITSDQVHQARDAAFGGFSFTSTSIKIGPSVHKQEYIERRSLPSAFEEFDCYAPLVRISNGATTQKLVEIAQEISFLDEIFAECFRALEEAINHDVVQEHLLRIRNDLVRRQRKDSGPKDSQAGYIGCLGEFCENVLASWKVPASIRRTDSYKSGLKSGKDCVDYLQDTLEIPYWRLVIDLFLGWRESNKSNMLGTTIIHTLRYKSLSCRNKVEELAQPAQLALLNTKDRDGLEIVLRSVRERLGILNDALVVVISDEGLGVTGSMTPGIQDVHSDLESRPTRTPPLTTHDASTQLALFVFFIILAFIPGYQGFAISAQSHENGKTNDSDFYYLMQSSIMSVLGNFATALPLLQSARISGPLHYFWAFSAIGLFSAVLSVVIYPLTNTGWSSVVSFVGTVASAASVLALTVATARERMIEPRSRSDRGSTTKGRADQDAKLKVQ
ncbi:hypothetical protein Daus18300_003465 [Diaporthe australafricana]|uniref:Uncharacterized protein n=1 Tax=Diaporthe australafricana TaxID=127596 RepID=A0ABR3XFF1_9PEZI